MNNVLILALPKSGTTILYQIIKDSMPPEAIGLFEPETCRLSSKIREAGAGVCAKVLLAQARGLEHYGQEECRFYDKKIMIVRDPRDVIVSLFLYLLFHSVILADVEKYVRMIGALKAKELDPARISFLDLVRLKDRLESNVFPQPLRYTLNEMNFMRQVARAYGAGLFRMNYQDIVERRLGALESFLGFPLADTREVDEKYKRVERTRGYGDWKNWFRPEDVDFFRPRLREYMQEFGLADDWDLPSSPELKPENGSEYVMNLARRAGLLEAVHLGEEAFRPAVEMMLSGDLTQDLQHIPGLRPAGKSDVVTGEPVLSEPRLVSSSGETTNLLRPGERYALEFEVKKPLTAGPWHFRVAFRRREVRLGLTLETEPLDLPAGSSRTCQVSIPFRCDLSPGVYLVDLTAAENMDSGLRVWHHLERAAALVVSHDLPELRFMEAEVTRVTDGN